MILCTVLWGWNWQSLFWQILFIVFVSNEMQLSTLPQEKGRNIADLNNQILH
jgi:hypothetical protein